MLSAASTVMSEVGDIEELLAALAADEGRMMPPQTQDLSQIQVLPDEINFGLQAHPPMELGGDGLIGSNQVPHGAAGGGDSIHTHDLLGSNIIEEAIINPQQPSNVDSAQPGSSSLGSLFLDSVDEILSNEKTTQLQFAPPQAQPPPQRAKAKPKKPVQRKPAIDSSPLTGSQALAQSGTPFSPGARAQVVSGLSPATSGHSYMVSQASDTFPRRQQQNIQLTRPHSNASDSSFYPGSVPQASPVGSVDSNINPRTPLSNNPSTPQSYQPPTPQSNLSLGTPSSRSAPEASLSHMQQYGIMSESDFLADTLRSPATMSVTDDQSHLQYLNTSTASMLSNQTQISGMKPAAGYQPMAFLQGQTSVSENFSKLQSFNAPPTSANHLPQQVNWPETMQVPSTFHNSQTQAFKTATSKTDNKTAGITSVFPGMIQTLPSLTKNLQNLAYSSGRNLNSGTAFSQPTGRDPSVNFNASESLTFNQSQLLDNLSGTNKSKPKSVERVQQPSVVSTVGNMPNQQSNYNRFPSSKDTDKSSHTKMPLNQGQAKSSVRSVLHGSESGIKQMFSQSIAYEAISPVSDGSPAKDFAGNKADNVPPHISVSVARLQDRISASTTSPHAGSTAVNRNDVERTKTGPLARRRSASKEQKQSANSDNSAAFAFEDDFGFDQNEPTIRLPTKRADAIEQAVPKSVAPEQPNPILVQTMQRENYSDPALFESVQELAVLQQKQKSLMEALNATRNVRPQQKPARHTQKSASTAVAKAGSQAVPTRNVPTAQANKTPKARRTSKTDYGKEVGQRSKTAGEETRGQPGLQKASSIESNKTDDTFYQQFLTTCRTDSVPPATTLRTKPFQKNTTNIVNVGPIVESGAKSVALPLTTSNYPRVQSSQSLTYTSQAYRNPPTMPTPASVYTATTTTSNVHPFSSHYSSISAPSFNANVLPVIEQAGSVTKVTSRIEPPLVTTSAKPTSSSSSFHTSSQPRKLPQQHSADHDILSYLNQKSAASAAEQQYNKNQNLQNWRNIISLSSEVTSASIAQTLVNSVSSTPSLSGHVLAGMSASNLSTHPQSDANYLNSMLLQQSAAHSVGNVSTSLTRKQTSHARPAHSLAQVSSASQMQFNVKPSTALPVTTKSVTSATAASVRSTQSITTTQTAETAQNWHSRLPWQTNSGFNTSVTSQLSSTKSQVHESTPAASVSKASVSIPSHSVSNLSGLPPYYPPFSDMSSSNFFPAKDAFSSYISQLPAADQATMQKSLQLLRLAQQQQEKQAVVTGQPSFDAQISTATTISHAVGSATTFSTTNNNRLSALPKQSSQSNSSQAQSDIFRSNVSNSFQSAFPDSLEKRHFPSISSATVPLQNPPNQKLASTKASDVLVTKSTQNSSSLTAAIDFSTKTTLSAASTTVSTAKLMPKVPEQQSAGATVDILKDKTYHGPKKKHILEKYSQQTGSLSIAKPGTVSKPQETRVNTKIIEKPSIESTSTSKSNHSANTTTVTASATSKKNEKAHSGESQKSLQKSDGKSNKNEQSGSIFSLFDSLLQEATESAKDSLKNVPVKSKPDSKKTSKDSNKEATKPSPRKYDAATKKSMETNKRATRTSTKASTKASANARTAASAKAASSGKFPASKTSATAKTSVSKASVTKALTSAASTKTTALSTSAKSATTVESTKTTAFSANGSVLATSKSDTPKSDTLIASSNSTMIDSQTRTPATFPFKRRHLQGQGTVTTSSISTTVSTAPLSAATASKTVKVASPSVARSIEAAVVSSSLPASPTTSASKVQPAPASKPDVVLVASTPTVGLKLRITAFRSAGGQVIHQSTLLGDLANKAEYSDDSDSYVRKKNKRKKRKKQRKLLESIKKLTASIPLITPKVAKKLSSSDEDFNDIPAARLSYSSDASDHESEMSSAKKRKTLQLPPKGAVHSNTSVSSDQDRSKDLPKSKKPPLRNVQRYKLKPTQNFSQSNASDASISFNRQPGKPPLYLNAGANQTLVSGSSQGIPTIQLVPRTSTKSSKISAASISSAQAIKLSSVNLNSFGKSAQPILMPKSTSGGVRYVLQTSLSVGSSFSPSVIIPKITPTTFSVGKATVFTVSSTGARVLGTPKIQIQSTPSQTSSLSKTGKTLPKQVVVKKVPVSMLPTIAISSTPIVKISDPSVIVSSSINVPCVVSFTSKPVKSSNKIIAPKPILATSLPSTLEKSLNDISIPQIVAPTITEALDHNGKTPEKTRDEAEFQSTFSNLISSPNPLSKYTPPSIPVEFLSLIDCNNQQCYECGDSFLFNKSLSHHYERRSILVKVRCVQCNQMLVFFNKCEILRHAREHSDHGEVMQFNGANLLPIPLSLCHRRSKEQFLAASNDDERSVEIDGKKTSACAVACTECPYVTDGKSTLEDHFHRRDSDLRSCDICKLPLHNQCVFSAHMRMHRHAPPHTCPECGQTFDLNKMEFNLHLRIQCFHLSRSSCFKCKLCNLTFLTDDQLRHHLRQNHVQKFYKCRECPMAFKTTQNIANHQRSAHNLTPEPTNRLKTIYKCPLCETVFTDSSHSQQLFVLHKHFDGHIDSARITAYKCYLCTRVFEQKAPLREHLQQAHDFSALNKASSATDMAADANTKLVGQITNAEEPRQSKKKSEKLVKKCSVEITNIDAEGPRRALKRPADGDQAPTIGKSRKPFKLRIKGMKSGMLSSRRASLPSTASSSPTSSSDDNSPPPDKPVNIPKMRVVTNSKGKKTYPCPECEKVFLSSHSRSCHVRSIHRGIRSLYCCTHCPVLTVKFAKRITLVKHLTRVHGIKSAQKEDIKIIRTQVPLIAPGEKFRAALIKVDKNGTITSEKHVPEKKMARKKITSGHARARRLAVQAGKRLRSMKEGLTHSESEESYGEVDEKTVEEGWNVEDDPQSKSETDEDIEVDASFFNFPDIYTCIKCDFQHSDRLAFQDHIVEHSQPMEPSEMNNVSAALTMVQCTECGLSFASLASLDKHMHIRHKIKRRTLLERYDTKLRSERLATSGSGSNLNSVSSTVPGSLSSIHRCKVCFRKFDTESVLKTHMRTHGLAFVKSKQH